MGAEARQIRGFTEFGQRAPPQDGPTETASADRVQVSGGGVNLNFVNVEIQEFVRVVYDEVFAENVVVDPALSGRVTVRTSRAVTKAVAHSLVREALQTAGATVVRSGAVWRVGPANGVGGRTREAIRIVPLRYIDAGNARQALQTFGGSSGTEIVAGGGGRFLIVAGRTAEVDSLEQIIATLDVDELRGRSFALVPLKQASAAAVSRDLGQMYNASGGQRVNVLPIERMNAVMVIANDAETIRNASAWITRLDQAREDQRRVFVYPVRNRRAVDIAKVLDGMLQGRGRAETTTESPLAPSVTPSVGSVGTRAAGSAGSGFLNAGLQSGREEQASPSAGRTSSTADTRAVEVRADSATNSLIVVARPDEYRTVESAIRGLDVLPTQVLIEATIAEVRLNQTLNHGVRWFFQAGKHGVGLNGTQGDINAGAPGFTYSFGVPNARLAINALESVTDVDIVSSPALTVSDNQTATLKVGDQVPIATRSARSVVNPDAPLVNDIEMKDTGIILQVTPRVNAGGLVMLDIKQEASDVVPTTSSTIDSPTIRQRQITTSVAVESGAEIILGGIITRSAERKKSGVPFLMNVPILGEAFTANGDHGRGKTELIIILRPTVMANGLEVRAVTEEIKARMRGGGTRRPVVVKN